MRFIFEVNPKDGTVSRWSRSAASVRIGRDPACDLALTNDMVSGQHASIEASGQLALLRDLNSTNGTFLNGRKINAPELISVNDVITLGIDGPTLTISALDEADAVPPQPPLQKVSAGATARPTTVRIGRAPDNDIVLDDPSVSAYHARLVIEREGIATLEDLGSTNGTAVGDLSRRIGRAQISNGDTAYFGSVPLPADKLLRFNPGMPRPEARPQANIVQQPLARKRISIRWILLAAAVVPITAMGYFVATRQGGRATDAKSADNSTVQQRDISQPDINDLARSKYPAVVWLGIRRGGQLFPRAAGWAVRPDAVVTTAAVVAELEKLSKEPGVEVVASSNDSVIGARSFQTHRDFSSSEPTSDASLHHNIGLVRLSGPLEQTADPASPATVRSLDSNTLLLLVGVFSNQNEADPLDRDKLKVQHALVTMREAGNDRGASPPLRSLDISNSADQPGGRWLDGAPLFSGDGTVVGILSQSAGDSRMIPIDASAFRTP
jgi:pSer/pThr/pTyr-binding forkhead associated (FHA) protein